MYVVCIVLSCNSLSFSNQPILIVVYNLEMCVRLHVRFV